MGSGGPPLPSLRKNLTSPLGWAGRLAGEVRHDAQDVFPIRLGGQLLQHVGVVVAALQKRAPSAPRGKYPCAA